MTSRAQVSKEATQAKSTDRNTASGDCEIAIVGAGPYGLSAGAHLKAKGFRVRIFGEPMDFWAQKMPAGMLLRSPREASSISDPDHAFTLESYEAFAKREPKAPLPLDTFVEYGRWFKNQVESEIDRRTVVRVEQYQHGFRLALDDGTVFLAHRVVVAAGIGPFRKKPEVFRGLSPQLVSHCYEGRDVQRFAGKRVAVIGAGQSALESAALIHEAGAQVEIIAREPLRWIGMHKWLHELGPLSRMLYSKHDVGPVGISRLVAYPNLVSLVPLKLRDRIRTRAVRPAGSRWLPDRLSTVKITTECVVTDATAKSEEVSLKLSNGTQRSVDHVLLGTGYRVDISRYDFLSPEIVNGVRQFDGYPKLNRGFSCSVPGLHFIGATAARSFGPLMYFVAGTEFTSRALATHLARHRTRSRFKS